MKLLVLDGTILLVLLWGAAWLQWRSERAIRAADHPRKEDEPPIHRV